MADLGVVKSSINLLGPRLEVGNVPRDGRQVPLKCAQERMQAVDQGHARVDIVMQLCILLGPRNHWSGVTPG